MLRQGISGSALALVFTLVVSCGSDDAATTGSGGGGGATGGAAGSSTGGTSSGGSAGAAGSSGGAAGNNGGAAGSSGGAAGGSTGGAGGAAGGSGAAGAAGAGGVTFINKGACPSTAPKPGNDCNGTALCCYEAGGPAYVCALGLAVDGGGQSLWKTVPNQQCCPAQEPTAGTSCTTPGVVVCCYGSSGFRCGTPQTPNEWVTATGC